jgi:ABC-type Fe3+/spermidine/putrescine transport system ATPase subunit
VYGIVGENGAGKSTLMKILSGVYTKDEGTIIFDGQTIEKTTPIQALRRGLSIIYQEFNLVNTMTVGENTFSFRTPSSGGSGLVVSAATTPTLQSGTSVSGGSSFFGGLGIAGGTISGGSSVSLSSYTGGNSMGGGGGWPGGWH